MTLASVARSDENPLNPSPGGHSVLDVAANPLLQGEHVVNALHLIALMLAERSGEQSVLQDVLRVLEGELRLQRGTVMLVSLDGRELLTDTALDAAADAQSQRYFRGEGVTGYVLDAGQPVTIPRISREPRFRNRIHRRRPTAGTDISFVCVPVVVGNEIVGTLSFDTPCGPGYATCLESLVRVAKIVASMIAADVVARRTIRLAEEASRPTLAGIKKVESAAHPRPKNMVGSSGAMETVYERIHQVAMADTTTLVRGESGTGKELVASAIHAASPRAHKPLVKVNCAALSENLLESELFGHERGAFTGAATTRIGRIEQAEEGTLFLDEIGDFSPAIQVKLLRVLQEREYQRVGANESRVANVRIITATNRNLEDAVRKGRFRQDLYYRINVFAIHLPPLRDRRADILALANHFVDKYANRMDKTIRRISTPAINMLLAYHWPGNVRELENCMEHAVLLSNDGVAHGHDLPPTLQLPNPSESTARGSLVQRVELVEMEMIVDALKRTRGNVTAAARELSVTPRIVRYKIKKLGIDQQRLVEEHG